jgi:excinuclease ABC subunit C
MTVSALDGISGLGRTRRTALIRHFGSVAALRRAGESEIAGVPGFGPATASAVYSALHPAGSPPPEGDSGDGPGASVEVVHAGENSIQTVDSGPTVASP